MTELSLPGGRVALLDPPRRRERGPLRVAQPGDPHRRRPERVAENRARLAASAGLEPESVAMGWQVHGADILEWDAPPPTLATRGRAAELAGSTATYRAARPGPARAGGRLPAGGPVSAERVAMVHCGWRGLAAGIVAEARRASTIRGRGDRTGDRRAAATRWARRCWRSSRTRRRADGRMLDLRGVAERSCAAAAWSAWSTWTSARAAVPDLYFSHRRDEGVTGRQGGLVVLRC